MEQLSWIVLFTLAGIGSFHVLDGIFDKLVDKFYKEDKH